MTKLPPRLLSLLERELSATRVFVAQAPPEGDVPFGLSENDGADTVLTAPIGRGLVLVVELGRRAADRAALSEKLAALVETFSDSLAVAGVEEPRGEAERPSAAVALHEELRALAEGAGASDAVVIDATSAVTWGAAEAVDPAPHVETPLAQVIHLDPNVRRISPKRTRGPRSATEKAIALVRALEATQTLPRGGTLSESARNAHPPHIARSFATIYVLILVFDAPFDQIRAERALQARLGIVERLVLALPPLEPTPSGGEKKAMRARS